MYADPAAALRQAWSHANEVLSSTDGLQGSKCIWVDANIDTLYMSDANHLGTSSFQKLDFCDKERVLSTDVREMLVWSSIIDNASKSHANILDQKQMMKEYERKVKEKEEADIAAATAAAEAAEADGGEGEVQNEKQEVVIPEVPVLSSIDTFLSSLYPTKYSGTPTPCDGETEAADANEGEGEEDQPIPSLSTLAIIGGRMTSAKLAVLNTLIDKVQRIELVGEVSIPFLSIYKHLSLPKYSDLLVKYQLACKALVSKAQSRGVQLILPVDAIVSEEYVPPTLYTPTGDGSNIVVDPDARDEGVEYDGDINTLALTHTVKEIVEVDEDGNPIASDPGDESDTPADGDVPGGEKEEENKQIITVNGYIMDIGPETSHNLQTEIECSDLVFVWGPAGVCEIGAFQSGTRVMTNALNYLAKEQKDKEAAEAAAAAASGEEGETTAGDAEADPAASSTSVPAGDTMKTIILGDSTVEWLTRIIDSDGELGGDLVKAGSVTYAQRRCSGIIGRLAGVTSSVMSTGVSMRTSTENEWVYSTRVEIVEEEDE